MKLFSVASKFPALVFVLLISCNRGDRYTGDSADGLEEMPIVKSMLLDTGSVYYIDILNYPDQDPTLPIGIFDSGTGGLTIMEAILQADAFNNITHKPGSDSIRDFESEDFIYLADQANMPYGIYFAENKSDLLVEHVIKDATFLLSDKYYINEESVNYSTGKRPVKTMVIACNTATAYGAHYLKALIEESALNVKVLGVIDAGARGALEHFGKSEDGTIGVLATVGTVASNGYYNSLTRLIDEMDYRGDIRIFSWGGHGIAEAVDEEPDFIDRTLSEPRPGYKGPSLSDSEFKIDTALLDIYRFDFTSNKMLCDSEDPFSCTDIQINDPENYMRYHIVSLLELIRSTPGSHPLKTLILGCTHYPYLTEQISDILAELYDIEKDGEFLYRDYLNKEVILVDPAVNLARELYGVLYETSLFNNQVVDSVDHEFYISVPNKHNPSVVVDENLRFTYEYKYGRNAGDVQEYIKVVPFSARNISPETIERLQKATPWCFEAITEFSNLSSKTSQIEYKYRIGSR